MTEKDKQIEKMAKDLSKSENCDGRECEKCFLLNYCKARHLATIIYNAGYRKQREGEWKILKMGDGEKVRTCSACYISQTVNVYKGKVMFMFCPYCGAKMKGDSEQ